LDAALAFATRRPRSSRSDSDSGSRLEDPLFAVLRLELASESLTAALAVVGPLRVAVRRADLPPVVPAGIGPGAAIEAVYEHARVGLAGVAIAQMNLDRHLGRPLSDVAQSVVSGPLVPRADDVVFQEVVRALADLVEAEEARGPRAQAAEGAGKPVSGKHVDADVQECVEVAKRLLGLGSVKKRAGR
jgi:hypothetical protein